MKARAKAKLRQAEVKADSLLRRLADSTWTVPILVIVGGLILVAFALK